MASPIPKSILPAAKKLFVEPSNTTRYVEVSAPPCLATQFSASDNPKLTLENSNIEITPQSHP